MKLWTKIVEWWNSDPRPRDTSTMTADELKEEFRSLHRGRGLGLAHQSELLRMSILRDTLRMRHISTHESGVDVYFQRYYE